MIYSVTFNQIKSYTIPSWVTNSAYNIGANYAYIRNVRSLIGKTLSGYKIVANTIKESSEDSFVFILTNSQLEAFDEWVKEEGLENWLVYRMPRAVTNGNHPMNGRNLTLIVFASRPHVWRDMFSSKFEWSLE